MKKYMLKNIVALTIALLTFPLLASSQNGTLPNVQWNATKVFDLDLEQVYNLYIDTLGLNDVETVICFQTKDGKLIKTDFSGNILRTEDNPYTYFTSYNGDTVIIKGTNLVNEKGDTIVKMSDKYNYSYIAASQSSIYVQQIREGASSFLTMGGVIDATIGFESGSLKISTGFDSSLSGLCCGDGFIFDVICSPEAKGILQYRKEGDLNTTSRCDITVNNPAGVAVYGDFLYVYSNTDKALYKLETPDGLGISALIDKIEEEDGDGDQETINPLNLDFIPAPNKMFVKKAPGVTNDYIVSLLEEQFHDKYRITGWYGDFCKVDVVENSLIDDAITRLLMNDSVMITRRIYYYKSDYEYYNNNGIPIDEYSEVCIFSGISYEIRKAYNQDTVDSLANVYGLTNIPNQYESVRTGSLAVPKTADIFDIAQKLYDTECFTFISLEQHMLVSSHPTSIKVVDLNQKDFLETQYYNLSGQRINTPSGLTIVVTRYSDGTVRTEKRLF